MKFRMKMTLCMLGLLSLLFGIGGSLLISFSFQNSLTREKDVAFNSYQLVLGTIQIVNDLGQQWDAADISRTMEQISSKNNALWAALKLTSADKILYEYGESASYIAPPTRLPEPRTCVFHYTDGPSDTQLLVLVGSVQAGNESLYLYTAHDITFLYETRQSQQQAYQLAFAVMALLCGILSYTVSRMLTAPLEGLSRAAHGIASGKFSSRATISTHDEIGAVAKNFNRMAARMEETISQLQDAVARQERFMGSFAHELKTPMTAIIGYADLLRSETLTEEEQQDAVAYIFSEGKRLESLSHKLLHLLVLKQEDLPLSVVQPSYLIKELVQHLAPIYESQEITFNYCCEKGYCLLEPTLIRSLLLNLIDNARKSLEKGGTISIRLRMLPDGCRISICDDGCGIPPEALAHLTEAFYRVDKSRSREQGGVGLGLTLCQEIVNFHHGTILFENQENEGACVTVELRGGSV